LSKRNDDDDDNTTTTYNNNIYDRVDDVVDDDQRKSIYAAAPTLTTIDQTYTRLDNADSNMRASQNAYNQSSFSDLQ
jgi:hypothetical protein